jgi:glycosyltransferase involved in cell wall biosynthesis
MRILLITKCSPLPPTGGDRQRTDLIYRALQRVAQTDTFLYRDKRDLEPGVYEQLQAEYGLLGHIAPVPRGALGGWRALRPLAPTMVDRLAHNLGSAKAAFAPISAVRKHLAEVLSRTRYDLVVSRYAAPAAAAAPWDLVPTIVDVDDYAPQVYLQQLEQDALNPVARAFVRRHFLNTAKHLPALLQRASHLWIPNPHDLHLLKHRSISVLPNIPYEAEGAVPRVCPPHTESTRLAMIGSLHYQVNIDGLNFFLGQAWPKIVRARPTARLRIIGHGLSDRLRAEWSSFPSVEVAGFVKDIHDAYLDSSFCIVPTMTGGGTKIKVVEALSKGRTCAVMRHAVRGYDHVLKHGESLLVADSADEIADACIRLIDDTAYRDRLAEHGRTAVVREFSFDRFAAEIEKSVEDVLAGR